ncbi:MAG: TonB-dependent receptor [Methanobacterium sp.]|nr:TonB-dependent receptor [Methanobacterium sp.]
MTTTPISAPIGCATAITLCFQLSSFCMTAASADDEVFKSAPGSIDEITIVGEKVETAAISQPIGANQYLLKSDDWSDALTGNNAFALVKNLPGVSYTSSDPFGVDISDVSMFVRGFHMNELGITFEGIPLNDTGFGTLTGTSLVNVGVPDAIGSVEATPGSARESIFSTSVNGGGLVYSLGTLRDTPTAKVSQSYGSNSTLVTTVSGQTGQLGRTGPKLLLDHQRLSANGYEGGGTQFFQRGDVKVTQDVPWGDVTLFFSGSHAEIWGYNNLSFDMIHKLGWNSTFSYPDYAQAYHDALSRNADASCGVYRCGKLSFLVPYDSGQTTSDYVGAIGHHFELSPALSGTVQFYGASSTLFAALADPTTPSPTGAPFSEEVQTPHNTRLGGTLNLKYVAGPHIVTTGLWLEDTEAAAMTSWYNEPVLGSGAPLKTIGPYNVYGPAFQTANQSRWRTLSRQFYLHDDYVVTDDLTFGVGFKAIHFSTAGGGIGPDHAPYGKLTARNSFLPHVSAFWTPNSRTDVFIDIAETEIGYRVGQRGNIGYSASAWTASDQQTFDAAVKSLRPETDWNFTVGAARRFDGISITYDAYYSMINNRLLSAAIGSQYAQVNTVGVVPHSHIIGSDAGITAKFLDGFKFYQGTGVSRFYYDDNLSVGGTVFPIKGKAQPGYPIISLVSDLSYGRDHWDAGITSTEYLDQPFSYENDIFGPNYWNISGHVGYTLEPRGDFPAISFRLDVSNLLDRHNIATLDIGGSPFFGDYQTLQRGAPRQFLFTVSAKY